MADTRGQEWYFVVVAGCTRQAVAVVVVVAEDFGIRYRQNLAHDRRQGWYIVAADCTQSAAVVVFVVAGYAPPSLQVLDRTRQRAWCFVAVDSVHSTDDVVVGYTSPTSAGLVCAR